MYAVWLLCACCLITSGLLEALTASCQAFTAMMKQPQQQQQQQQQPLEAHRHRLAVAITTMCCAVLISRQGPPGQPQMVLDLFPMLAAAGSTAAALLRSWQVGYHQHDTHSCHSIDAIGLAPHCREAVR
jgi:hypothetical protein